MHASRGLHYASMLHAQAMQRHGPYRWLRHMRRGHGWQHVHCMHIRLSNTCVCRRSLKQPLLPMQVTCAAGYTGNSTSYQCQMANGQPQYVLQGSQGTCSPLKYVSACELRKPAPAAIKHLLRLSSPRHSHLIESLSLPVGVARSTHVPTIPSRSRTAPASSAQTQRVRLFVVGTRACAPTWSTPQGT